MLAYIWKTLIKAKSPTFEKIYADIEEFKHPDPIMPSGWVNSWDDVKLMKHLDKSGFVDLHELHINAD